MTVFALVFVWDNVIDGLRFAGFIDPTGAFGRARVAPRAPFCEQLTDRELPPAGRDLPLIDPEWTRVWLAMKHVLANS